MRERRHRSQSTFQVGERTADRFEQRVARLGRGDRAGRAHEQLGPQRAFECLDRCTQPLLTDTDPTCRPCEAELLDKGDEVAQLLQ